MIRQFLLNNELIFQAALSIWIVILRFMGDIPEPPAPPSISKPKRVGYI